MTRPQEYVVSDVMSNGNYGNGFLKRVPAPPRPSRTPAFPIYDNLVDREFLAPSTTAPPPGEYPGVEAFTPYSKYKQDESAFDMTGRGERPTYYPYLEHYQPSYPARPKPHRTPTRSKRPEPKVNNKYHTHSDQSDDDRNAKEVDQFMEPEPPKRKKKAKRRANRAALEQKRQEIEMETFKEFASTVTADYLAEMCSKASNGRRLIWVSLWLASFVYAWYNIALSIGVYMSKPTATKLNFYEASSDGVTFPTVTICNFNKFNKSYFDTDDITTKKGQLKDFLKITTPIWGHKQELDSASWDTKYDKITDIDLVTLYKTSSHLLNKTVEYCRFSGKPCLPADASPGDVADVEDADPTAAFNPVFTEHGLCYSFNQNGNLTMSRTGALYGLSLRLHVAQDDYFETQDVAGFKVLLHNSYEPPMIEEYGFALRPGSETYVRIRLQKYKDTPRPLGYCDPYLEDQFSTNYTISVCVMQYRAINMLKVCGCITFYMDRPDIVLSEGKPYMKPKICNLKEERTCADNVLEGLALGTLKIDGEKVPEPDCPSPCVYTTYTYTVSQSEYPSSAVKDKVVEEVNRQKGTSPGEDDASSWTIERIRDNYLKVHIYFEELSTLEMERHPSYLISNLIGDVGGQLGLLLGMNICSLVQFTDYIVRFSFFKGFMSLVRLYKARRRNK
ncbi:hypothetical protein ACHWQZ_G017078 [Mnemiopsis leidyi]